MTSEPVTSAKFITFYSFKGGVGRSMALINTASILASRRGFRVLALDLDLEAPGISYLDPEAPEKAPDSPPQFQSRLGFVDLIADAKARGEHSDLFKLAPAEIEARYTRAIKMPEDMCEYDDGSLRIMPAGRIDGGYGRNLASLDLEQLYRDGVGEPLIRAFKQKLADSGLYDYVLVDSRTGLSDGAGICTRDLADHVMVLSGLNRQNVEGTSEFLREFRVATDGKKSFQIILSPVPNGEDELFEKRRREAEQAYTNAAGTEVELSLEIPYHPQLALTEEPHIFRRRRGYLFEAYQEIERAMLREIGHTAEMFYRRALEAINREAFPEAVRELRHMIRLNGGRDRLLRLLETLLAGAPRTTGRDKRLPEKRHSINSLLASGAGQQFLDFVLTQVPVGSANWTIKRALRLLRQTAPARAEKLLCRVLNAVAQDADDLGGWAIFLADSGDANGADEFFRKAIEVDPKDADNLSNYALFLRKRGDLDGAETFYKRAIEADPKDADNLGNYADFLEVKRGDLDGAETFYKRAIEADPKDADNLGSYADFLETKRRDLDGAETFYQRAIEANPKHAGFLMDYGQLLFSLGRMSEAKETLQRAWSSQENLEPEEVAEFCVAFWLLQRATGRDGSAWEQRLKFFLNKGFERYRWSFDRILAQAKGKLSAEEFEYAQALAAAHQDETKVAALDAFPRWKALAPLAPDAPDSHAAS